MEDELRMDRSRTALVVIDLQKGIALDPSLKPHSSEEVIDNGARLIATFRDAGMPVFLVVMKLRTEYALHPPSDLPPLDPLDSPEGFADLVDGIVPAPSDIRITKHNWGAFYGTELVLQLRRRRCDTMVLCGVATNYGVESTARDAYERGYQQVFAEDAMTSGSEEEHRVSVNTVLKRLGRVRPTAEIIRAIR
jgi:nicotinamidase-related amidase